MPTKILKIEIARKIVQIIFFTFFFSGILGVNPIAVVLPISLSSASHGRIIGEAFSTLQWMLSKPEFPFLPLASFLLVGVFLGRFMCGWLCPFGLIQELISYIRRRKFEISLGTHRTLVKFKYVILFLTLLISGTLAVSLATGTGLSYKRGLGKFASAPYNTLSPHETLFSLVPAIALRIQENIQVLYEKPMKTIISTLKGISALMWTRMIILIAFVMFSMRITRFWCKYLCPTGALMALIGRFSFLSLRRDPIRCTKCRKCMEICPMTVRVMDLPGEKITDPECIYCFNCIEICEEKALKVKLI